MGKLRITMISHRSFAAAICLLINFNVCAGDIQGRVIRVTDGDTITILDGKNEQHKIRLAGIDAPEKKQAFGTRSKQALSDDVFGKTVIVDWNKRDRYKRIVGKVMVDGQDMNLKQVKRGMAWHYKKYEGEQDVEDRSDYAQAEDLARRGRLGLWRDDSPVAPWDFRRFNRK